MFEPFQTLLQRCLSIDLEVNPATATVFAFAAICNSKDPAIVGGKTGALTVAISPLVALMGDQVQGMVRAGIASAVTINGMLLMPEPQDALDKVRMGDASMLPISPEQLRSNSVRSVLKQREFGL